MREELPENKFNLLNLALAILKRLVKMFH